MNDDLEKRLETAARVRDIAAREASRLSIENASLRDGLKRLQRKLAKQAGKLQALVGACEALLVVPVPTPVSEWTLEQAVGEWLFRLKWNWSAAYLTARDTSYKLTIIANEPDDAFKDEVSRFVAGIANDPRYSGKRLDAMILPPEAEGNSSLIDTYAPAICQWRRS